MLLKLCQRHLRRLAGLSLKVFGMLRQREHSLLEGFKLDLVAVEAPLPSISQPPCLCCFIPVRPPRIEPALNSERLLRKTEHRKSSKHVFGRIEVGIVVDAGINPEDPLVIGLVKGLGRLL